MSVIDNLNEIKKSINSLSSNANVIVVSKNFCLDRIQPLINSGHIHFGENRVQEAIDKWIKNCDKLMEKLRETQ